MLYGSRTDHVPLDRSVPAAHQRTVLEALVLEGHVLLDALPQ
jgi:hypothetical protein